ncbi:hypothetical protein [Azospirillum doebereinerae]|uniref:Uncharacterized protein n=1 Tax=Azospirillum doebereinerae TaxID=92933 RepID=A0A433J1X7_9PROT|nr:hypothetical protein [Azospirillum doebereinerae]MCG5242348.1 hypothetical protein [Azospirillum doebereinerae]RUQ65101.1 hypothetical protein EJ913_25480 [Azospirillum doebereinerae]
MHLTVRKTREQIKAMRQAAYLKAWPAAQQLEAQMDRVNGDPTKWTRMQAEFAAIRSVYPWPIE